MTILINLLLAIFVLVSILMVLIILMQRPKSEGLGAAFGAGMTENIFGAQTTNVLQKFTVWLAGIFLVTALALTTLYAHKSGGETGLRRELARQAAPGASPTLTPAGSPTPTPADTTPGTSPETETPSSPAETQPGDMTVAPAETAPASTAQPTAVPPENGQQP